MINLSSTRARVQLPCKESTYEVAPSHRRLIAVALLFATASFAQTDRGTITGTVTDPASAMVPGAVVVAKNSENGSVSQTTTTATGNFTLTALPAGVYEVSVEAPGFKKYIGTDTQVQVA